jgi:hypothetical protein
MCVSSEALLAAASVRLVDHRSSAPSPAAAALMAGLTTVAGIAGFILFLSLVAPTRPG